MIERDVPARELWLQQPPGGADQVVTLIVLVVCRGIGEIGRQDLLPLLLRVQRRELVAQVQARILTAQRHSLGVYRVNVGYLLRILEPDREVLLRLHNEASLPIHG